MASPRPATLFDLSAIRRLQTAARLPIADLAEHLGSFVVVEDDSGVVATGGYEKHGELALLRSVTVAADRRRRGLGRAVVDELVAHATAEGRRELWLLCLGGESAEAFFGALGFRAVPRAEVPRALQRSRQFSLPAAEAAPVLRRDLS